MEKSGDGKWHEVEDANAYGEEFKKYNQTMIGRILVLLKFKEDAKLWTTMSEESFMGAKCSSTDAACALNKKMADVIYHWRHHL